MFVFELCRLMPGQRFPKRLTRKFRTGRVELPGNGIHFLDQRFLQGHFYGSHRVRSNLLMIPGPIDGLQPPSTTRMILRPVKTWPNWSVVSTSIT